MTQQPDQPDQPIARDWKRYWRSIGQRRADLAALGSRIEEPQEFHILGGGVAGLAAAVEILRLPRGHRPPHRVRIYEATERVGGRINTLRLGPKPPAGQPDTRPSFERGAMRIPASHEYTWTYAAEAGLERRKFVNHERLLDFRGTVLPTADYERLARLYGVRDREAHRGPGHLFGKNVLGPEMAKLDETHGGREAWARQLLDGRITGYLAVLDQMSVAQVLRGRLPADPGQIQFIADLQFAGLTDRSFLMFVRSWLTNAGQLYELCRTEGSAVVGGMDLLVDGLRAMVEAHGTDIIRTGRQVESLFADDKGDWRVEFRQGEPIAREGRTNRHLLCTLPFAVVRNLRLRGFEPRQPTFDGLSRTHATKVALHVKRRFWDNQGDGGRSLSDRASTSTYYPNDGNPVEPIETGTDAEQIAPWDLYTQPAPETPDWLPAGGAETGDGPWLMLSSYTFGARAEAMRGRDPKRTADDLERIHPGMRDEIEPEGISETWSWHDQPTAGAAFALPAPGELGRHFTTARLPFRRVFFAGDHVSMAPGWIQGSLFSSLYAVQQILLAVGGRSETPVATDEPAPGDDD